MVIGCSDDTSGKPNYNDFTLYWSLTKGFSMRFQCFLDPSNSVRYAMLQTCQQSLWTNMHTYAFTWMEVIGACALCFYKNQNPRRFFSATFFQ